MYIREAKQKYLSTADLTFTVNTVVISSVNALQPLTVNPDMFHPLMSLLV